MERYLDGRIAIVTGAAQGIGFAVAHRLARAGAQVAVADVNVIRAAEAAAKIAGEGLRAQPIGVDVSDEAAVGAMIATVHHEMGPIAILVNNAGVTGGTARVEEIALSAWDRTIAVNLRGVFLCCRAVLPDMRAAHYGRIVNVASIAGKEGNPGLAAYSASKAAVIGFTKSLAKEVAQEGIIVNAISPAVIQTEILDQLAQETIDYMVSRIPLGRTGTPEEVAALIGWLVGDECTFTTGQCIDISGGRATY
jgi:NAD(P)-dependent dehydrogenase (short-subunit alcohol dehydrogenase family)